MAPEPYSGKTFSCFFHQGLIPDAPIEYPVIRRRLSSDLLGDIHGIRNRFSAVSGDLASHSSCVALQLIFYITSFRSQQPLPFKNSPNFTKPKLGPRGM